MSRDSHRSRDLFRGTAERLHLLLVRLLLLDLLFNNAHIAPENAICLHDPSRQRFVQILISANCVGWRVQPKMKDGLRYVVPYVAVDTSDGLVFLATSDRTISREVFVSGQFEPDHFFRAIQIAEELVGRSITDGLTVVEVGANIGTTTILAAKIASAGHCYRTCSRKFPTAQCNGWGKQPRCESDYRPSRCIRPFGSGIIGIVGGQLGRSSGGCLRISPDETCDVRRDPVGSWRRDPRGWPPLD